METAGQKLNKIFEMNGIESKKCSIKGKIVELCEFKGVQWEGRLLSEIYTDLLDSFGTSSELLLIQEVLDAILEAPAGDIVLGESPCYEQTVPDSLARNKAKLCMVGGKSVVWNQLSDCVNKVQSWAINNDLIANNLNNIIGHKVLMRVECEVLTVNRSESSNTGGIIVVGNNNISVPVNYGSSPVVGQKEHNRIIVGLNGSYTNFYTYGIGNNSVGATGTANITVGIIDLTAMFGAGNEPTGTSDARIACIEQCAELNPEYNEGEVVSADVESVAARNELEIPQEIRNVEGYGWGISDECYNYVDFERKVFVKKVGKVDLGSLGWTYNTSFFANPMFYYNLTDSKISINKIQPKYEKTTVGLNLMADKTFNVNSGSKYIYVRDDSYTDATAFKEAMNGVYLYYELAEPIETDIYEYITSDKIEVESGGTVTFKQENYHLPVPNKVEYMVRTQE